MRLADNIQHREKTLNHSQRSSHSCSLQHSMLDVECSMFTPLLS
jgi:hypothetical protein